MLLALFARAGGRTVGDPNWPDGLAPHRPQEMTNLLVPLALYAHAEGSPVEDHTGTMARCNNTRRRGRVGWCCWHLSRTPTVAPWATTSGAMA